MRVLVTTTGYPGHVMPVLPFARAFQRRGHEVCVAGPRSAGTLVRDAGLAFCGWSDPPSAQVAAVVGKAARLAPEAGHALMIAEGFGRVATRAALPEVLHLVGAWRPDVVVRESQEFAGHLAAERHRVAQARIALGLAISERETAALVAPTMQQLRAEHGSRPTRAASASPVRPPSRSSPARWRTARRPRPPRPTASGSRVRAPRRWRTGGPATATRWCT